VGEKTFPRTALVGRNDALQKISGWLDDPNDKRPAECGRQTSRKSSPGFPTKALASVSPADR
jgi:hypothetical protein